MNPTQPTTTPPPPPRLAKFLLITTACLLSTSLLLPCGPFLPGSTLGEGQQGLNRIPELNFLKELARTLNTTNLTYNSTSPLSNATNTLNADLTDLKTALSQITPSIPPSTQHQLLQEYTAQRTQIHRPLNTDSTLYPDTNLPPRITNSKLPAPKGLPREFTLYFDGAVAWHQANLPQARKAWSQLLQLPENDRRYRSTWAVFMLGRSWENVDHPKAIRFFQQTRQLATNGFIDSLKLAHDSLGFEARLHSRDANYATAMELYLEQARHTDYEPLTSLHFIAKLALQDPRSNLTRLARNATARNIITAYVLSLPLSTTFTYRPKRHLDGPVKEALIQAWSHLPRYGANANSLHQYADVADVWLNALRKAKVKDVPQADRLALAAYQRDQMDLTQQWLQLAPPSLLAQWLQSRLLMRQGDFDQAGAILSKLCRSFATSPDQPQTSLTNPPDHPVYFTHGDYHQVTLPQQMLAEWSVLLLARQQYVDALHALILSSYYNDAAYVAERVLTLEELQTYIREFWPLPTPNTPTENLTEQNKTAIRLHDLLARRLARLQLYDQAKPHLRQENQPLLQSLQLALENGRNPTLPNLTRGRALSLAAITMRRHGLELVGTETEPDWGLDNGNFSHMPLGELRNHNDLPPALHASPDEIQRYLAHTPANTNRWHYRYLAANLAWEASKLLPDNSDETARILALGGSWLKNLDPKKADPFYKSLVNRCRKTSLGQEADQLRWFPPIDQDGNPLTPLSSDQSNPLNTN
jgi:hypothetical protein